MEKTKKLIAQGIRFSLVGVINTLIDTAAYYLLTLIPFFAANYALANAISYSLGVINSLYMNKHFTFGEKGKMGKGRVALFFAVNIVSLGVSTLALHIGLNSFGLSNIAAKLCAVALSLGVNFTLNKLLVFKTTTNA